MLKHLSHKDCWLRPVKPYAVQTNGWLNFVAFCGPARAAHGVCGQTKMGHVDTLDIFGKAKAVVSGLDRISTCPTRASQDKACSVGRGEIREAMHSYAACGSLKACAATCSLELWSTAAKISCRSHKHVRRLSACKHTWILWASGETARVSGLRVLAHHGRGPGGLISLQMRNVQSCHGRALPPAECTEALEGYLSTQCTHKQKS